MEKFSLSKESQELKLGRYQHFKGPEKIYEVIGVALHSETSEELVVYKALYGEKQDQIFARPLKMFLEIVDKPELNYKGPRFRYIG